MNMRTNLFPCAHCNSAGTCKTGVNGSSCAYCIKAHELTGTGHVGLPCGTCDGLGQSEPITERMTKRYPIVLSLGLIYPLIIGLFLAAGFRSEYFTALLAFAGPVVGGIVAFYFSTRSQNQP